MVQRYVILDKVGGWLDNVILWDGNLQTWQPPEGTIVKLESEIDYATLPVNPNSIVLYTAEQWLTNQGYDATQLVTFADVERQLVLAGKASFLMDAVRAWANSILAEYVANPVSKSDWPVAPYTFNEAITDGFNILNQ